MDFLKLVNCDDVENKIIMNQESNGIGVRGVVRNFLSSKQKTEFFDNLDDFANCLSTIHNNAKIIAVRINR